MIKVNDMENQSSSIESLIDRVKSYAETRIDLFPNPSTGLINLKSFGFKMNPSMVTLLDITGRRYEVNVRGLGNDMNFDCSSLQSGIYFVKIQTETDEFILRFVKD